MSDIKRIVVFTSGLTYTVRKQVVTLDLCLGGAEWLLVLHEPRHTLRQTARRQWRNLRRHGWRRFPALADSILARLGGRAVPPPSSAPGLVYSEAALRANPRLSIMPARRLHCPEVVERVTRFAPDLGLSLAAPMLRQELFDIPRLGTLNLHKGKVPDYRGMPPAFWELWNGEPSVGCTIHWVEAGLDTGAVAKAATLPRERYSTVRGLQLALDELGVAMVNETVGALQAGQRVGVPQPPGGATYRQPTLSQIAALNRRLAAGLPYGQARTIRIAKDAVRGTALCLTRTGQYAQNPSRVTVLLYHRVTDSVRDNLTVGVEQFERHMMLIRRHFRVIDLADLITMDRVPDRDRPTVCITFDDGYLDNFTNAAAILLRHEIPATFFVSTGMIGTTRRFPHDVRRGNPPIPLMTWDHLRHMRADGFTIGSHTVNHIDCAAESTEVVRAELVESRVVLRRELGLGEIIFSYPYGDRHHMTPERLAMVKEAGYIGCVSAYGGTNKGRLDRFNVLRQGIHWESSDTSFLYTASGLWK